MGAEKSVTVIWECNCYVGQPKLFDRFRLAVGLVKSIPSGNMASVWLVFGGYDHDRDDHDYREMGTRILGPVANEQADCVIEQLQRAFVAGGFEVTLANAADD